MFFFFQFFGGKMVVLGYVLSKVTDPIGDTLPETNIAGWKIHHFDGICQERWGYVSFREGTPHVFQHFPRLYRTYKGI